MLKQVGLSTQAFSSSPLLGRLDKRCSARNDPLRQWPLDRLILAFSGDPASQEGRLDSHALWALHSTEQVSSSDSYDAAILRVVLKVSSQSQSMTRVTCVRGHACKTCVRSFVRLSFSVPCVTALLQCVD